MNKISGSMIHAQYTVVLKTLMDSNFDFGLDDYPLYTSTTESPFIPSREELNNKILNHFKYREIGFETPYRFADELNIRMNEIMPKYNYLMKSLDLTYNPLDNVDYTKIYSGTDTSSTTGTNQTDTTNDTTTSGTTNTNSKNISSDTPQNLINVENIDDVNYANNISFDKSNNTDSGSSSGTSTLTGTSELTGTTENQHEEHLKGNYGVKSSQALIQEYRDIVTNYVMDICDDLNDLFMQIY